MARCHSLCLTTRKIWKDYGKIQIKQIGACYFFEFRDEDTKFKALEGGPYFFSRRYLVLKDWHRMLIPSTEHPSTIPAWVKIHKLPLECWTEEGFSRIASTIGKPLHVDIATAKQQRIDYARVCVEISAKSDLPKNIQISDGCHTASVAVEYQWLPPKCNSCKVFGHSCKPKPEHIPKPEASNDDEAWQMIGTALGGGGDALEVVTKVVPHATGSAFTVQPDGFVEDDSMSEGSDPTNDCPPSVPSQVLTPDITVPIKPPATSNADPVLEELRMDNASEEIREMACPDKRNMVEPKSPKPPDPPEEAALANKGGDKRSGSKKKSPPPKKKGGQRGR